MKKDKLAKDTLGIVNLSTQKIEKYQMYNPLNLRKREAHGWLI